VKILYKNNIKPCLLPDNFDFKNKIPDWVNTAYDNNINSQALFKILGANKTYVADISEYESPDIIIDLNYEIQDETLFNRFNTIIDVGTLEHIFDINIALTNLIRMLKVNGRIFLSLPASNSIDHGFYSFSPTLFFDFFKINGFSEFSCYLREGSPIVYEKKSKIYEYSFVGNELPLISKTGIEVIFHAKKLNAVDQIKKPIQNIYQSKIGWVKADILSNSFEKKTSLRNSKMFISIIKFYGGKYFPSIFEIIKKFYIIKKRKNIKLIGKF